MIRLVMAIVCVLAGCSRGAAVGGTIVLEIGSSAPIERIHLRVYDPRGTMAEYTLDTHGRDLTKEKAIGEVTPGVVISGGRVLFVAQGFDSTQTAIVSGRAEAAFQPNQRVTATLSLRGGIIDVDEDGFPKSEDCDDNNSKRNRFFEDVCGNDTDDDCDGTADRGCPCVNGRTRGCYNIPDGSTRNLGECRDGTQTCAGGIWGECLGAIGPIAETCNNLKDEDCDGTIDENCPCTNGTKRFCHARRISSTTGTEDELMLVGECRAGVQSCNAGAWGDCLGAVLATNESCNGKDDDCDGALDDGFDVDSDGFTSCGTLNGVCNRPASGGVASDLVDCDDGDAARHPCQADRCGDGGKDEDCSGAGNECSTAAGDCATAGFYAGWLSVGGRQRAECHMAGNSFGNECDPSSLLCKTASVQCVENPGVGALSATRTACNEVGGCDAGTTSPPTVVGPLSGTDPYDDCGALSCDNADPAQRIYRGKFSPGGIDQCLLFADPTAAQVVCVGGSCQSRYNACMAVGGTGSVVLTAGTCQTISGCTSTPSVNTPPTLVAVSGANDPGGRCPRGGASCIGRPVLTDWAPAGTGRMRCDYATANPSQLACVGGSCGSATNGGCALAPTGSYSCATECRKGVCNPTRVLFSDNDACYNAADEANPDRGPVAACNGPNGGMTCADETAAPFTDDNQEATCVQCNKDKYCGASCDECVTGIVGPNSECRNGWAVELPGPTGSYNTGVGITKACICTDPAAGRTMAMYCRTSAMNATCCAVNQRCTSGGCSPVTGTQVACGSNICNRFSQYCDVSGIAPTCQSCAAERVCNQTCCAATERCASFDGSTCADCTSSTSCGPSAINCSSGNWGSTRNCSTGGGATVCANYECRDSNCGGQPAGNGQACVTGSVVECTIQARCGPNCLDCGTKACLAPGPSGITAACAP